MKKSSKKRSQQRPVSVGHRLVPRTRADLAVEAAPARLHELIRKNVPAPRQTPQSCALCPAMSFISSCSQRALMRKILIMGLPGAGKTTLATALAPLLNAVISVADAARVNGSHVLAGLGASHANCSSKRSRTASMAAAVASPAPGRSGASFLLLLVDAGS
jgi:hypothetical protein